MHQWNQQKLHCNYLNDVLVLLKRNPPLCESDLVFSFTSCTELGIDSPVALQMGQEAGTLLTPCGCVWTRGQGVCYSNLPLAGQNIVGQTSTASHSFYLGSVLCLDCFFCAVLEKKSHTETATWCLCVAILHCGTEMVNSEPGVRQYVSAWKSLRLPLHNHLFWYLCPSQPQWWKVWFWPSFSLVVCNSWDLIPITSS